MNWLVLRKNNIPLIDLQVDKAITLYIALKNLTNESDMSSIQKLSQLQLSIKKRIKEMDEFYNHNCLDMRVRYLQGARLKLSRLIYQKNIQNKQLNIPLPWKLQNHLSKSRNSVSGHNKNVTPRKINHYNIDKNQLISPTPIVNLPIHQLKKNDNIMESNLQDHKKKKKKLELLIPQNSPTNFVDFSSNGSNCQTQKIGESQPRKSNTNRKLECIPQKTNKFPSHVQHQLEDTKINDQLNQECQAKSRIANEKKLQTSNRSKPSNGSGKSRTLTEGSQNNSIKKINDLIFRIKMTKEDYEGFLAVKKQLNDRVR